MAKFILLHVHPYPLLSPVSALVITQELDISEPAADSVRIAPFLSVFSGTHFPREKSHTSMSGLAAPLAISLAESITEPPPTARIKSTPSDRQSSIPFLTRESSGLATTPPNSTYFMFSSSRAFLTLSNRPLFLADWPP